MWGWARALPSSYGNGGSEGGSGCLMCNWQEPVFDPRQSDFRAFLLSTAVFCWRWRQEEQGPNALVRALFMHTLISASPRPFDRCYASPHSRWRNWGSERWKTLFEMSCRGGVWTPVSSAHVLTTTLCCFPGTGVQANGTIPQEDGFHLDINKTVQQCWLMMDGPSPSVGR